MTQTRYVPIVNQPDCAAVNCTRRGTGYLVTAELFVYRLCAEHVGSFTSKGAMTAHIPPVTKPGQYPANA